MTILKEGNRYSRRQIYEMLGGNIRSYLPTKDEVVRCGCFRPENRYSPEAPDEVDFGPGTNTRRDADLMASQEQPIPVFLRRGDGAWEYVGRYRCTDLCDDADTLRERMAANPERGVIAGVLLFKRAE